jgi:hypothetical protein
VKVMFPLSITLTLFSLSTKLYLLLRDENATFPLRALFC